MSQNKSTDSHYVGMALPHLFEWGHESSSQPHGKDLGSLQEYLAKILPSRDRGDGGTNRGHLIQRHPSNRYSAWSKGCRLIDDNYQRVARIANLATEQLEVVAASEVSICINQIHTAVVREVDEQHVLLVVFAEDRSKTEALYSRADFVQGVSIAVGDQIIIRITGELVPRDEASAALSATELRDERSQADRYDPIPTDGRVPL